MGRIFRVLGIVFALSIILPIIGVLWSVYHGESVPKASVLHVLLDGPLSESPRPNLAGLVGGRMHSTVRGISQGIRRAATDERIVGLVLDIRTPAVGMAQLAELHTAMEDFRKSGKWNVSYLETAGEMGHGDGAYALACGAKEIWLSPPGEINLSGLRSEVPFVKDGLARFHVQAFTEQRYEFKNFANTFTQDNFTPEHKEALKSVLDDLQGTVLGTLAAGRGITPAQARSWVENAPWSSAEALKAHLVDKVGYWDEVISEAERVAGRADPFMEADAYSSSGSLPRSGTNVALIVAAGEIALGDGGKSPVETTDGVASNALTQAFRDAREDEVKAVLLRIDSPGGSYIASDLIRREVELTRKANIPVVVSMGNVAASGGYFIAAEADHIIAQPGTITGSIGVFAASFALRDFLQHWLGVNFGVYETIPHPGNISWLDVPNEADRGRISKTLDRIYADFVTKVAAGRHKKYEEIHAIAKGRIWSGRQALDNGLVDELGGLETAVIYLRKRLNLAEKDTMRLVYYPEPDSPLALVRDMLTGHRSAAPHLMRALAPLEKLLAPAGDQALLAPDVVQVGGHATAY